MSRSADSLGRRYLYKVLANGVSMLCGVVTQAIAPRALGPAGYGDFSFLSSFFTQVVGFFDSGTSTGFYTKLSQRRDEPRLAAFYAWFMAGVAALVAVGVAAAHLSGLHRLLWPGQGMVYVYMGLLLALLTWLTQVAGQMADAHGLTVSAERGRILQRLAGVALIGLLFWAGRLTLASYFLYNYVAFLLLLGVFWAVLRRQAQALPRSWTVDSTQASAYGSEFYRYASPLFVYSLVVMGEGLFDRWLLQVYGGSIQQGFYGLSYQIGAVCFLFSGAMTTLIMREFSIAHGANDLVRMAGLFRRHIPLLYSVTAYISCFVAVNAEKIALLMGGGRFQGATLPVFIMALFPIHQTYGQLVSAVYFATAETRLYRNLGVGIALASLPISYFLIAPPAQFGLGAGAVGLALKMLVVNVIGVNLQLYYISKKLRLTFWRYAGHQVLSGTVLLALAGAVTLFGERLAWPPLAAFLASGAAYTACAAALVWRFPVLFGLHRQDISTALRRIRLGGAAA
jgi:O-antigen/teichoic acid export membrane protein